ncbi:protein XNDC1N isoform X1 [Petromyzon marinus]|uniref:protein XNDC1N isoform X1 n=1 Tax=Petromyzon marinus TaxID=7757 RepID=UPI003F71035C
MAPLRIRHVVSFTSQDPDHPAQGLLAGERWLCDPSDRSGLMRAELQLELASLIAYIDIGTVGVGLLQVEVGRSSWAQDTAFLTLLPTTVLLSAAQSKAKHNETSVRMFNSENFTREVMAEQWDRVRVTCTQPFHKSNPFGVTFISFRTSGDSDQVTELVQPSCPATPRQVIESVKTKDCEDRVSSKPWLALPAIRRTFFTPTERNERVEKLKERLSRLAPKSKSGCVDEKALPRTARLLLTAAAHYSATDGSLPPIKANSHAAQSSSSPIGESTSRDLSVRRLATTARTPPAVECGVQQATGTRVAAVRRAAVQTPSVVSGKKRRTEAQAAGAASPVHMATCTQAPHTTRAVKSSIKCPSPASSKVWQGGFSVGAAVTRLPVEAHRNVRAGPDPNHTRACPMCSGLFNMEQLLVHAATCGDELQQVQGPGRAHPGHPQQETWPHLIYTTSSTSFLVSDTDDAHERPLSDGIYTDRDTVILSDSDGDDGDVQVLWDLSDDSGLVVDDNDDDDDVPRQREMFVSSITCPICRKEFPPRIIEQHASQCGEDPDRSNSR